MKRFGENQDLFPIISVEQEEDYTVDNRFEEYNHLPLLALRNIVLFPGVVLPISIGREQSLSAVKEAKKSKNFVLVSTQKNRKVDHPGKEDLYETGTVSKIIKTIQMPDGGLTAIVQGQARIKINEVLEHDDVQLATYTTFPEQKPEGEVNQTRFNAIMASIKEGAEEVVRLTPSLPQEAIIALRNIESDEFLLNFITSNLDLSTDRKQEILEISSVLTKAEEVLTILNNELNILQLKDDIRNKAENNLNEQQRNYYLNQQLRTIQEELGQGEDAEVTRLEKKAKKIKWSKDIQKSFESEIDKLKRLNTQSPEYSVQLNYLELMTDLPWEKLTKDKIDLEAAEKILNKDHFGLDKVKHRILEYLAVLKLKGDMKSPILCFVGPPGVGKTSLGKSIAASLGREYIRMSLGGLHDESEIRGHRRTYIGSMPGRIIQSLKKAGTSNPVIVLDEIDKIGKDFRGDPSSALLEVLDPEQNSNFHDNYLDLDYDLSKVLFIATANSLETIQPALRDRMEIIPVSGYSQEEKLEIADRHLFQKQLKAHGLKKNQISISKPAMQDMIAKYTRESGVRSLDRVIASVMRHSAKEIVKHPDQKIQIKPNDLNEILGPTIFDKDSLQTDTPPGVAVGLAWTSVGGDILYIESVKSKGKGNLQLTGKLGDVMKESAKTALSFIKSNAKELGINPEVFTEYDIHVHVPEGAVPKDGPSAGITILTTITSLLTDRKVKPRLAMTGEITLRGRVLPVGGIKEKILAANRIGITDVILSSQNEKHIKEIDQDFIKDMNFHYVDDMMDVIKKALI